MNDSGFREIQLSGKQVVFLFMAGVVVAVGVFLLGVMAGRGVSSEAAPQSAAAMTSPSPTTLPPATSPQPGELQYHETLQGKPAPPAAESPRPTPATTPEPATVTPAPSPAAKPAPAAAKPAASAVWFVQVDSFGARENAARRLAELKGKGYAATIFTATGTTAPYKVRIGPMDEAAADAMIARLRKEGYKPSRTR
jgi:cell division protein FtsN